MNFDRVKQAGKFWAFDTEDNSQGLIYWINFYNGIEHVSFDNRDRALEWLYREKGEFWACNLEYDLVNVFGPLLDYLCVLTYGGFGLLKASIQGKPVQFRNTLRHWPMSVEEMGVKLGFPKLSFDPTNLDYCKRDTEVTWLFIASMMDKYYELGVEEIKATLPSTSLAFFTDKWCKVNWYRHGDINVWNFLAESRYGGRCEIFQTGEVRGHIHEYDLNSSYPAVMTHQMFPNLDTMRRTEQRPDLSRSGVVRCQVTCPPMEFPLLPYKDPEGGKLLFPVGTFVGTWTYVELQRAMELGYTIDEVYDSIEYDLMPSPFAGYMQFIYARRREVKGKDELMSYTLKILMNALFGKWGEAGELRVISRGKQHFMNQVPKHSNMIWAAYVLAYGRLALYQSMLRAGKAGRLLYVDTDSIFIQTRSAAQPFPGSTVLGELDYKGHHTSAEFKLPKLYRLDTSYKAKGVKLDKSHAFPEHLKQKFFEGEEVEFLKPYRFLEAKRLQEQANVWREVTKRLQSSYDKREMLKNGRTWPLTMGKNSVYNTVMKPKAKPTRIREIHKL